MMHRSPVRGLLNRRREYSREVKQYRSNAARITKVKDKEKLNV